MARIRTIKPEFWNSDQVVELTPLARLFFIGLWNFCDDQGVHKNSPRTLRADIFPGDDDITSTTVLGLIDDLSANGLIGIFEHDDVEYIHVLNFLKHQRIEKPNKKHPKPPSNPAGYKKWSSTGRGPQGGLFDDLSTPEGKGKEMEGKGKEESILANRRTVDDQSTKPAPAAPKPKPERPTEDVNFETWWTIYPRRVGKGQARKAYATAAGKADAATLLDGAKRYAAERVGENQEYTKHPSTWLNGECWLDQPKTAQNNGLLPSQTQPSPGQMPSDDPDERLWRPRLDGWDANGTWYPNIWGYPPTDQYPDVPQHILAAWKQRNAAKKANGNGVTHHPHQPIAGPIENAPAAPAFEFGAAPLARPAPPDPADVAGGDDAPSPWVGRLEQYFISGGWSETAFGPKPGQPGCRVPAELIAAFGGMEPPA